MSSAPHFPIGDHLFTEIIMSIIMGKVIYTRKIKLWVGVLVQKVQDAFFMPSYSRLRTVTVTQEYQGREESLMFWDELQIQ